MPAFQNNALLLKTDGTIEKHTVTSLDDVRPLIACQYPEMTFFGRYPISDTQNQSETLIQFLSFAVTRGQQLPAPKSELEYDFHRIDQLEKIQLWIHDEGAINGSPRNPFISGLYGHVVILGQCIDELSWNPEA